MSSSGYVCLFFPIPFTQYTVWQISISELLFSQPLSYLNGCFLHPPTPTNPRPPRGRMSQPLPRIVTQITRSDLGSAALTFFFLSFSSLIFHIISVGIVPACYPVFEQWGGAVVRCLRWRLSSVIEHQRVSDLLYSTVNTGLPADMLLHWMHKYNWNQARRLKQP